VVLKEVLKVAWKKMPKDTLKEALHTALKLALHSPP